MANLAPTLRNGLPAAAAEAFAAPLLEHFFTASPGYAPLADALVACVGRLATSWPEREPMRVLLVGARDGALSARLAACLDPSIATLTVTDTDEGSLSRAARRASGPDTSRTARLPKSWKNAAKDNASTSSLAQAC